MSTPPTDAERRRAQNRENLRAHYGIGRGNGPLSPLSETGRSLGEGTGSSSINNQNRQAVGDPLNLDSPGFSAQQYYANLVTKASLPELIKESVKLTNEVKNLNSSRHSLVYNHHHQLFAAGDTISKLNAKTPELQAIMNSLHGSFDEMSRLVNAVQPSNEAASKPNKDKDSLSGFLKQE